MTPNDSGTSNTSLAVCFVLSICILLIGFASQGTSQIVILLPGQGQTSNSKASQSPTPDSKDEFGKSIRQALATSRMEQERQLNEHGPRFPDSYDSSHFTMTAFLSTKSSIVVEYDTLEEAEIKLAVSTLSEKGFQYFVAGLKGTVIGPGTIGSVKRAVVELPAYFGVDPQPGVIGIRAQIATPKGKKDAPVELHGMGVGVSNPFPPAGEEGTTFEPASYRAAGRAAGDLIERLMVVQSNVLNIITVSPETISIKQNGKTDYSFVANTWFGEWAADFRSITTSTTKDGRQKFKTKWVKTYEPGEQLLANTATGANWDGLNFKGRPSIGRHKLVLRAWSSKANGGAACVRTSRQTITVQ